MNAQAMTIVGIVMGIITFIFATASSIPQIIDLRKTRNTSGISLTSYIIVNVDNVFWLIWTFGYYVNSMLMYDQTMNRLFQVSLLILVFAYVFGSILVAYLLAIKIIHLQKAKQLKVTELQLAKILLDKDKGKWFIDNKWNNSKRYLSPILFIILDALFTFTLVALMYVYAYIQPISGTKEWIWVVVLSFICSFIWEVTSWPQLVKSIKEKDMTGISLFWAIFMVVNCIVNFVYDFSLSVASGSFNYDMLFILIFSAIAPNIGILVLKIKNIVKAKKAGMSELEYTKTVLIPIVKEKQGKKSKTK